MYEQLKLENQVCFRLYTASRLMTRVYRPFLEPLNLTYPQYLVMLVLWEQDNRYVNDIAKLLKLDTNTVTPLLKRMEMQGFLMRSKGVVDNRQTLISLTKKGKQLQESAKNIPECIVKEWQANGKTSTEQLAKLVGTLDSMIADMSEM